MTEMQRAFWQKVDKTDGCWNWTGSRFRHGYGQFRRGKLHAALAHCFAYTWAKGPIPEGYEIDHLCRNRRCVNPDHLEAVTHQTNMLRGDTFARRNAERTHCIRGHEWSGMLHGARYCKTCAAERMAELRKKDPEYRARQLAATRRWYRATKLRQESA